MGPAVETLNKQGLVHLRRATAAPLKVWHWGLPQSLEIDSCISWARSSAATLARSLATILPAFWVTWGIQNDLWRRESMGNETCVFSFFGKVIILMSWWMLDARLEPGRPKRGKVQSLTPILNVIYRLPLPPTPPVDFWSTGQKVWLLSRPAVAPTRSLVARKPRGCRAGRLTPVRPSPLNKIFLSPCFVWFIILFVTSILCFGGFFFSTCCVLCWHTLSLHLCLFVCFACAGRACWFGKVFCCRIRFHCFHCCFTRPWRFVRVTWNLTIINSLDVFANLNDDMISHLHAHQIYVGLGK